MLGSWRRRNLRDQNSYLQTLSFLECSWDFLPSHCGFNDAKYSEFQSAQCAYQLRLFYNLPSSGVQISGSGVKRSDMADERLLSVVTAALRDVLDRLPVLPEAV